MRAEIKGFDCADHDPIAEWVPEDPSAVDVFITFHIGPVGGSGADLFHARFLAEGAPPIPARAKRFALGEYSFEAAYAAVKALVERAEAPDWDSLARGLAVFMDWEFENYTPAN
jgi:hypothetical protein